MELIIQVPCLNEDRGNGAAMGLSLSHDRGRPASVAANLPPRAQAAVTCTALRIEPVTWPGVSTTL